MLLTIDITGRCNLRCITCYNAEFLPNEMTSLEITTLIRAAPKNWEFYFLGGEPLLRRDFLDILRLARDLGHETSFSTNATLIDTPAMAHKIIETDVAAIYVSLDGPTAETNDRIRGQGSFQKVLTALRYLEDSITTLQSPTKLCISVTATDLNMQYLPDVPRLLDSLGIHVEKLGVVPVSTTGRADGRYDLRINPASWLTACREMCREWRDYRRLSFLCLPNSALTVQYLATRYDLILAESVADCPILQKRDIGRVLPTGEVVPCSGRLDLIRRYNAVSGNRATRNITELVTLGEQAFSQFIEDHQSHTRLQDPICNGCPHFEACEVCPLENSMETLSRNNRAAVCDQTLSLVRDASHQAGNCDVPTLHALAQARRPFGLPYFKHRRFGDRVAFFPKQERFAFLNDCSAEAMQQLIDGASPTRVISEFIRQGQSRLSAVGNTNAALSAMQEIGYQALGALS